MNAKELPQMLGLYKQRYIGTESTKGVYGDEDNLKGKGRDYEKFKLDINIKALSQNLIAMIRARSLKRPRIVGLKTRLTHQTR
jgi:hypothetical protein